MVIVTWLLAGVALLALFGLFWALPAIARWRRRWLQHRERERQQALDPDQQGAEAMAAAKRAALKQLAAEARRPPDSRPSTRRTWRILPHVRRDEPGTIDLERQAWPSAPPPVRRRIQSRSPLPSIWSRNDDAPPPDDSRR